MFDLKKPAPHLDSTHHVDPGIDRRSRYRRGKQTTLRYRQDARPRDVVQDRRASQIYRFERTADCSIIEARRRSSVHLHRPWRANFDRLQLFW